jgi:hypothetical protein
LEMESQQLDHLGAVEIAFVETQLQLV